jgi:hypothetical protein
MSGGGSIPLGFSWPASWKGTACCALFIIIFTGHLNPYPLLGAPQVKVVASVNLLPGGTRGRKFTEENIVAVFDFAPGWTGAVR